MKKEFSSGNGSWFDSDDLLNQILLLLVGVVVLLVNLGMMDRAVLMYWPIILIIIGLRSLLQHR